VAHGLTVVTFNCGNVEGCIGLCVGQGCFLLCVGRRDFSGVGGMAVTNLGLVESSFDAQGVVVSIENVEELEFLLPRLCPCVLDAVGEFSAE
jgi:hypothetical protein